MPSFNFKQQFSSAVKRNTKGGTIRSTKRCKPGDTMHLFTGMRTKQCKRLVKNGRKCLAVVPFETGATVLDEIKLNGRKLTVEAEIEFAKLDGFANNLEMIIFFRDTYGLPYTGYWHVWKQSALDVFKIKPQL